MEFPAPSKSDPISLIIPENSSITEKNMVARVKEEMLENGFNYNEKNPKYLMAVKFEYRQIESGSQAIPYSAGRREILYQNESWLTLNAFKANDPKKQSIWNGESGTTNKVFNVLRHSIIKTLLDYFGKTINQSVYVDKNYKDSK